MTTETTPKYSVRVSKRAKRPQINISPLGQMEIVVPSRFDTRLVPVFVSDHQHWINKTLNKIKQARAPFLDEDYPTAVNLLAIGEIWKLNYHHLADGAGRRIALQAFGSDSQELGQPGIAPAGLSLDLNVTNSVDVSSLLVKWLQDKAKQSLAPWVQQLSEELNLPYASVQVRAQKTRWGSCSSRKCISLNRSLMFLPAHVVRYLIIHELCHTRHLNHSHRYWQLVQQFEPQYKHIEAQLNKATRLIPAWAMP